MLPLALCQPGDVVAAEVRTADGRTLLRQGMELTGDVLRLLDRWGVREIPVRWPGFEDIDPEPWLPDDLVRRVTAWWTGTPPRSDADLVEQAFSFIGEVGEAVTDHRPLKAALELVPVHRTGNPAASAWLSAALLLMRAASEDASPERVEQWAAAALLAPWADPAAMVRGQVGDGEDGLPRPEPVLALAERLQTVERIPAPTVATLAQHRARWDGRGVPPLKGDAIYRGAQWLGAIQVLTHLIFRTDGQALAPHEALEWVAGGAGSDFALPVVQGLTRTVAPYAAGQVVRISPEGVAVVLEATVGFPGRPRVRLLSGPEAGSEVNLADRGQETRIIQGPYTARDWQ
ncbi:Phosphohydrolase [Candidatus Hydrogenisulfobacillus filiaventi]|uniref:Phosphohydrolase n=1 Tax=Candidatus Hydrogenisulfobacillus filiaventi TaxID=2707344 RepID=A0A6F8ZDW5_9FIRM|nr:Phosphohydrolase [Candidatus Hydrogenisulfobacillus filiaventi]